MYRFLFVAVLLPIITYGLEGDYIKHFPCVYSHSGTPHVPNWIWVEGCNVSNCTIPNGSTRTLRAGFNPLSTHHRLRGSLRIFFYGIEIPVPQPEELKDLCEHIEGGCPIYVGRERVGEVRIQGESIVTGVKVTVEVSVFDDDTNHVIACGGAEVTITANN